MNKVLTLTIFILFAFYLESKGQSDKVKFWANARGFQQNARLGKSDTVNSAKNSSGYVLADVGININPLKNTEIQTIIRLRSELGGFFGAGSSVNLRRLYLKGLIANTVGYELGDIFLKVSPYTLYNSNPEGAVNEATVFSDLRKDIIYYDNFYRGNYWWQQGAHAFFATGFRKGFIDKIKYDAFLVRNRTTPTMRLYGGGKVTFASQDRFYLALNYVNLFDDRAVNPTVVGVTNPVATSEILYKANLGSSQLVLGAEGGYSSLNYNNPLKAPMPAVSKTSYQDFFMDGNADLTIKNKIKVKLGYRYVGPDFRSAGAQTKRINFASTPDMFVSVANDPYHQRNVNLFDITRSTAVYNNVITTQLMTYDPRLANAMPYGAATPNRQGVYGEASYSDSLNIFNVGGKAYLLYDVVGVGTTNKRSFQVYQILASLNLNKVLDWEKQLSIYGGVQFENTKRSGNISAVKLNSQLADAGVDIELFRKFYLVGGAKILSSKGNEFLFPVDQYNQLGIPVFFSGSTLEQLFGYGIKYSFGTNTYLTVQNQNFIYKDRENSNKNYSFNQFFIMFFMKM